MPINEQISPLELAGIRADAEQVFAITCDIDRRVKRQPSDVAADASMPQPVTNLYTDIRCSIYPIMSRRDRFDEFGQSLIFTRQYRLDLPYDTDNIRIRDLVTVKTSTDSRMLGRVFEVRDVVESTHLGYRRATLQDAGE